MRSVDARAAWAMWGLGATCYLLALFHRMSLSAAGLTAQERFDVDAVGLATFAVVQLALYGGLQIPVGAAADRFGPKRLICTGMVLMAAGSAVFALAGSYPIAVAGRALIGTGDAFMFVSVLRIAHNWFPGPRYAQVAALTGMVGGLGQLVATAPLSALLGGLGWAPAFLLASVATGVLAVVVVFALREAPVAEPGAGGTGSRVRLGAAVRAVWRVRGSRHAMWAHFTLMGTFVSVTAVLGQPYLVGAHGVSRETAAELLSGVVAGFVLGSTACGRLASRRPVSRGPLVLTAGVLATTCTLVLVVVSGPLPVAVLAVVLVLLGCAGGASMVAFDLARTANAPEHAGVASGVVNVGGFTFAVLAQFGAGATLDLLVSGGVDAAVAHRLAFGVIGALALVGTLLVALSRRHAGAPPVSPGTPSGARLGASGRPSAAPSGTPSSPPPGTRTPEPAVA